MMRHSDEFAQNSHIKVNLAKVKCLEAADIFMHKPTDFALSFCVRPTGTVRLHHAKLEPNGRLSHFIFFWLVAAAAENFVAPEHSYLSSPSS